MGGGLVGLGHGGHNSACLTLEEVKGRGPWDGMEGWKV